MAAPKEKVNTVTAIVFDFETGGLDATKCAATQISLHAVRLDTFEIMEKLNLYILPYNYKAGVDKPIKKVVRSKYDIEESNSALMEYTDRALEVSGITMELLRVKGQELQSVCEQIIDFIARNTLNVTASNKPFLVGQNVLFDIAFMQQIMLYTGLYDKFAKVVDGKKDFWGHFQPYYVDTILFAKLALDHDKSIGSWKLELSAERLGIDLDDAHDADADVTATREIVRVLTARMRNSDDNSNAVGALAVEKRDKLRDHFKI